MPTPEAIIAVHDAYEQYLTTLSPADWLRLVFLMPPGVYRLRDGKTFTKAPVTYPQIVVQL